eukprot:TRINITY_DN3900_c0_g2_i1.p1 TRINITY_DN3900_c0_g2~~TRINITY_DN3900_c0_g2_i1.p1  ORF type:complete len:122 (+),score=20.12 TRINITY_DN3900_c0_g2_i1:47-412(+)
MWTVIVLIAIFIGLKSTNIFANDQPSTPSQPAAPINTPATGAYVKQDENKAWEDSKVRELIRFGLEELQKKDNDHRKLDATKLLSYQTQVVAGTNHRFVLDCKLLDSAKRFVVTIIVYEKV